MSLDMSADKGADVRSRKSKKGETPEGTHGASSDKTAPKKAKRTDLREDVPEQAKKKRRNRRRKKRKPGGEASVARPENGATVTLAPEGKADKGANSQNRNQKKKPRRDKGPAKALAQNGARPSRKAAVYSAIDLGTNNCRLLIAKQTKSGFRVIDAFSRIVRLGEGVGRDNRLSEEAMDRTIEALKVCADKLARRNVTCMRHVATEACRIAENSDEFVERVRRETGINLDVISAAEEARLAVLGCQSLIAPDKRNVMVFDIGGGSTELIWVKVRPGRRNEIMGWMSVPWGVVNLTEQFTKPGKTPKPKKYSKMMGTMEEHLRAFEDAHELRKVLRGRHTQFLGTSGTVTTLASLHLGLPRYVRDKVDGAWMKSKDIRSLSRRVAEMTPEERAAEPCIGSERADLVVAGCAILESILSMWDVPSLRVADRGIREGILRGLMETDPMPRHAKKQRFAQSDSAPADKARRVN